MITDTRQNYRVLLPGLLLGLAAFIILIFLSNSTRVFTLFGSFKWTYFGVAVGLNLVHHALRFLNLSVSLNLSGIRRISLKKRMIFYISSSALTAADPKSNDSYRSVWLSKACGIPLIRIDSIFLIDQLSDGLSILALATLGILAYPAFWPFFALLLGLFILSIVFLQIKSAGEGLLDAGEKLPLFRLYSRQLRQCMEGNERLFKTFPMTISLLLNVLSWIALAAALFFILVGFGLTADLTLAAVACLVLAFSIMIGFFSTVPGGLGVIELALAGLLTFLLGFQPELAVTATILFRMSTFWISLLFGILFWSAAAKSCAVEPGAGSVAEG